MSPCQNSPFIQPLIYPSLRGELRPRNSSTSSFSGSPVPKIEEEIDSIDDFGKHFDIY